MKFVSVREKNTGDRVRRQVIAAAIPALRE